MEEEEDEKEGSSSCRPQPFIKHEIFLSHSGEQKGFVKDLYDSLSSLSYNVFFDQDKLPPGQDFPCYIFSAAKTCTLAVLVLSTDFLTSKWPMIELCIFADRYNRYVQSSSYVALAAANSVTPPISILPLFYKLRPEDLKKEQNLKTWREVWRCFEEKDKRMSALKCEEIVANLLPRLNGEIRLPERVQGPNSYMKKVVEAIYAILPPRNLCRFVNTDNPNQKYVGKDHLFKLALRPTAWS